MTYGMVQVIGLELVERITWTTQVLGQRISQSLIKGCMLHVDHD